LRTTPRTVFQVSLSRNEIAPSLLTRLAACVYTSDIARALRVSAKIKAGTIGVNSAYLPDANMPFGGYKQSGNGRELGKEGLMAYLQTKAIKVYIGP
jgi:aldehyde dehydrogenase (NAD+)